MRMHREYAIVLGFCALGAGSSAADPIWQNSNYFATTRVAAMAESPFDFLTGSQGGDFSGLFPPRDDIYTVNPTLPDGDGDSFAGSRLTYSFEGNILSIFGHAAADVTPGAFMIGGSADSTSALTVQFDLPAGGTFHVIDGSFDGTHASSAGTLLSSGPDPVFTYGSSGNQPNGEAGALAPGGYSLELEAIANSNFFFSGGLFADSSFSLQIEIIASSSCPGDLNADGLVDDADFTIFVVAYNILDCADPFMPAGCPADLNSDGFVDDADFVIFVVAYNELLCP
ncbi:MAG: hypothetical protein KF805_07610 [Phycisphaeraceae bacterium]|nr:hypothetical protein [Phycisphaeraceae bacterium]